MKETWRWFGSADEISIGEVRQTGAAGIVTALHHIPTGDEWRVDDIKKRQGEIANEGGQPTGMVWEVAESVPVSEAIKSQSGNYREHLDAYRKSLLNLAECGVHTVCYNFMPILDWTRTELASRLSHGGTTMSFDLIDFVAFDCFILKRSTASDDYSSFVVENARERYLALDDDGKKRLTYNIVAGLPGANDSWSLNDVHSHLEIYQRISANTLRSNLVDFLSEVVPTAESVGVRLCCHPDDPPFPLLGLPRVMSSQSDYEHVMNAVDSQASGITLCTGSLGVSESFDPVAFIETLGSRIHFAHLRNSKRQGPSDKGRYSFHEAEHLAGDTDMVATICALINEERRRRNEGRCDDTIPMRPDHGQALLSDLERPMMPGYPLIGRMKGLAELRGITAAHESPHQRMGGVESKQEASNLGVTDEQSDTRKSVLN